MQFRWGPMETESTSSPGTPELKSSNSFSTLSSWLPGQGTKLQGMHRVLENESGALQKKRAKAGRCSAPTPMFADAGAMKDKLRRRMTKEEYNVTNFYNKDGIWQSVARKPFFENCTLVVIVLNAAWIAVDTELNDAEVLIEAPMVFQVVENLFCLYFTGEILVRFAAFASKRDCVKDAWFVFDSLLVTTMVLETWVLTLVLLLSGISSSSGNASILRIGRLMRLTRMARMARLLRAMPELLILLKGMLAAARSVLCTLCLLCVLMYVFGIAFKQLSSGTEAGRRFFDSLPNAMHSLLLNGTLLDNLSDIVSTLRRDASDGHFHLLILFYFYVLLSSLLLMNMLIGVLCEVVSAVSQTEREQNMIIEVKDKLRHIMLLGVDEDQDGKISEDEFCSMLENEEAAKCLQEVGVDVVGLVDVAEFIFEDVPDDRQLSFEKFVEVILDLRGSNTATVKDIVDLRKFVLATASALEEAIHETVSEVTDALCKSSNQSATTGIEAHVDIGSFAQPETASVTSNPSDKPWTRKLRPTVCLSSRRRSAVPGSSKLVPSASFHTALGKRRSRLVDQSSSPPSVGPQPLLTPADSGALSSGTLGGNRTLSLPHPADTAATPRTSIGGQQAKVLQLIVPDLTFLEESHSEKEDSPNLGVAEKSAEVRDYDPPKSSPDGLVVFPLADPVVPPEDLPNEKLPLPDGSPPILPGCIGMQLVSAGNAQDVPK